MVIGSTCSRVLKPRQGKQEEPRKSLLFLCFYLSVTLK